MTVSIVIDFGAYVICYREELLHEDLCPCIQPAGHNFLGTQHCGICCQDFASHLYDSLFLFDLDQGSFSVVCNEMADSGSYIIVM